MMRWLMRGLAVLLCVFSLTAGAGPVLAGALDAGNAFCPVSGDKISGEHFAVYEGKRYAFCCARCIKKFNKNPEKYLAKMGKRQEKAVEKTEGSGHDHHDHHH